MKISEISGGLGNQVLQYIFARYIEIHGGESVLIDHSHTQASHYHDGFDLPRAFPNISLNLWKDQLNPEEWAKILETTVKNYDIFPYYLAETQDSFTFVHDHPFQNSGKYREKMTVITAERGKIYPEFAEISGECCYFSGVWKSRHWFFDKTVHPILQKELDFAPLTEAHNLAYAQKIAETNSVSVHIRRGDLLSLGLFLGYRYYQQATKKIRQYLKEKGETPTFFIFSDEISWCCENRDNLGFLPDENLVFVDGNQPGSGTQFRDMQLMSLCRHLILADSTFSLVASYLNQHQSYISPIEPGEDTDWVCHLQ